MYFLVLEKILLQIENMHVFLVFVLGFLVGGFLDGGSATTLSSLVGQVAL